jgi:hypothetical protein
MTVHVMQDGCKAELEGVTFTGRTDLAASRDAPAISMALSHMALCAGLDATARLKGVNQMVVYQHKRHKQGGEGSNRGGPQAHDGDAHRVYMPRPAHAGC